MDFAQLSKHDTVCVWTGKTTPVLKTGFEKTIGNTIMPTGFGNITPTNSFIRIKETVELLKFPPNARIRLRFLNSNIPPVCVWTGKTTPVLNRF